MDPREGEDQGQGADKKESGKDEMEENSARKKKKTKKKKKGRRHTSRDTPPNQAVPCHVRGLST